MPVSVDADALRSVFFDAEIAATGMENALTGFQTSPWIKRAGAGYCVHTDSVTGIPHLHIGPGWNYATQSLPPGHFRTSDFVTIERAIEPIDVVPSAFAEMCSARGKIRRAGGLFDYPFGSIPGAPSSHCTNAIYTSDTGSGPWSSDPDAPTTQRECLVYEATDSGTEYLGLGVGYAANPPPTYYMPVDFVRRTADGPFEGRSTNNRPRRSVTSYTVGEVLVIGCGRDDTQYPDAVDLNDFIVSTDGAATFQSMGAAPFRGAYGRRATKFGGGVVLTGGAYSVGTGTTANTDFLDECWFMSNPLDLSTLQQMPALPIACVHHIAAVLTIGGVETLALIGGYNSNARPDGSPYGTIYTTTDLHTWTARTDSGFWVG